MKIFVTIFAVITITSAGVIENNIDPDVSDVKENYKQALHIVKKILNENVHPQAGYFYNIFERSIDIDCAAEKVKKFGLEENLAEFIGHEGRYTQNKIEKFTYVMTKTVSSCSSKSRPTINFMFDLFMSFGHIVRAFKDEPELAKFSKKLKCLNNYAVEIKMIDPSIYPLDYTYTDHKEKTDCDDLINYHNKTDDGKDACEGEKKFDDTFHLVLKPFLLTQVKLTPEQHHFEADHFFNEYNRIVDKMSKCEFKKQMAATNEIERKILNLRSKF